VSLGYSRPGGSASIRCTALFPTGDQRLLSVPFLEGGWQGLCASASVFNDRLPIP
jgi:hypothetical protein